MTLRDKIFSFQGRLRRRDYWLISIGLGLAVFLLTELAILAMFGPTRSLLVNGIGVYAERAIDQRAFLVQNLFGLTTLWPAMAMSAKRAHDRDKGAGLVITLILAMSIASYAPTWLFMFYPDAMTSPSGVAGSLVFSVASAASSIYILIVVGCLDGTPGPNRFGPSPKADDPSAPFTG